MKKRIAIVGCGPRGLSSLEALLKFQIEVKKAIPFHVTIFEPEPNPGAGLVWNPNQSESNWVNISNRALEALAGRPSFKFKEFTVPSFSSYSEWVDKHYNNHSNSEINCDRTADKFPPRYVLGQYLSERYQSIAEVLIKHQVLDVVKYKVCKISNEDKLIHITDSNSRVEKFNECVLTIGHQPTFPPKQISNWQNKSNTFNLKLINSPYNEEAYKEIKPEDPVAIRGFGLASIDIIRLLTLERGGAFKRIKETSGMLKYVPSSHSIQKIVPFSLDGLPPMPKPLEKSVDELFKPNGEQSNRFRSNIRQAVSSEIPPNTIQFLIRSFSEIASEIFTNLKEKRRPFDMSKNALKKVIKLWLNDMETEHDLILNIKSCTEYYMSKSVEMAKGKALISLDYCLGQIWRHLQPTIYQELSHSKLPDAIISEIIALDESTKRYSYGPPVESMEQLIALSKSGVLALNWLKNPETIIGKEGWTLRSKNNSISTKVMVNSVLDPPKLDSISSELVVNLKNNKLLGLVTNELGIETKKNGLVVLAKEKEGINLSVLGRNSKGSVIGVDAILECFGPRIENWAVNTIKRLNS